VKGAKAAPEGAGNVWTWTALDADTKPIVTWNVGGRNADSALTVMEDLRDRVKTRMQLTTDGLRVYLEALQEAFGVDGIDYPQLPKKHISTSYVERQNLNMRMGMRRFTRLTNAFSKKLENHCHALALYFMFLFLPHP
jgi:IS1 family transposase